MSPAAPLRSLLALFFISGALGLGYQVLWSKMVLHFVGVSSWSYAIVLAAFMAGLALGGRFLARIADRVASPLALFGWLELLIGVYAIAYPSLADSLGAVYHQIAAASPQYSGGLLGIGIKALLAGLLLLPPTILMGATFPAMVRHATPSMALVGRRASQFYSVNALGAVIGAPAMAFFFIPSLGLRASLTLLALGNAIIGLVALVLARREAAARRGEEIPASAAHDAGAMTAEPLTTPRARILLFLLFAAGTLSFACEIAWTRLFSMVIGSSTYSFAIIVSVFIAGISVGSGLLSRFDGRVRDPLATLGWSQVLAGILILAPLPAMPYLPWLFGRMAQGLPATAAAYWQFEAAKAAICALVMFPPALLMGLCIPLAVKVVARGVAGLATDTGRVHSANTAGNVLGSLAAGLILLPWLGTESLLRACACALALIGVAALALAGRGFGLPLAKRVLPAVAAIVLFATLLPPWDPAWFTLAPFRREPLPDFARAQATVEARRIRLFADDPAANLLVMEQDGPEGIGRTLYVNGKPDASSTGDMATQILLGHLPLLAHGSPRSVLVVGLASGTTCGAIVEHDIERMDVVEIVHQMPAASRLFDEWNGRPLDDARTRVIIEDARAYLSTTRSRYDVIVSQPTHPWVAGVGSLFAQEHFQRAKHALAPRGIYAQWLQSYDFSDETVLSVVATFREEFPHVLGFAVNAYDMLLLGSVEPFDVDFDAALARARPAVRDGLAAISLDQPGHLDVLQCWSQVTVDWLATASPVLNTDDNLLLEHVAPRDLFLGASPAGVGEHDERIVVSPTLPWARSVLAGADPSLAPRLMAREHYGTGRIFSGMAAALADVRGGVARLDPEILAGLPKGALFRPPPSAELSSALRGMIATEDWAQLERFASHERATLAYRAAVSAEAAAAWEVELGRQAAAGGPSATRILGPLRAEILAAAGKGSEARAQLEALLPLLPPERLALTACRVDPGTGCDTFLALALERAESPHLARYLALRRGADRAP